MSKTSIYSPAIGDHHVILRLMTDARTTDQFEAAYQKLNAKQKQAVDAIEGPVLVVAGPGSGKTQILSLRVGNILKQTDALPSNILCLTFTESAAANMRERLTDLIGRDAYRVAIHTFHNFGVDVIERHPEYFFQNADFAPADELVQVEIITGLLDTAANDNPLAVRHPEQGYTYLHSIRSAIASLKKAGLSPTEFRAALDADEEALAVINPWIDELFMSRVTKDVVGRIEQAIRDLRAFEPQTPMPVSTLRSLTEVVADSLERAMQEAADDDSTKPISAWKDARTKKDEDDTRVLKDTLALDRMRALADIYEQYMAEMYRRGYYDFDDMLLHVIQEVEQNAVLRNELREQFRYVLVDEFQDTNDAQQRLLNAIADAPVNEGRPNLMAVGDDDQAIYKFQGAEVSNVIQFRENYTEPTVVTMTENYRSGQGILDLARFVINKGEERLERRMDDIEKQLTAANPELSDGDIEYKTFPTRAHEYAWVASHIRQAIDEGATPGEIAVIARQHRHLQELLPYLYRENVPIRYERQQNVLHEPHVRQLIQLARFTASLGRKQRDEADVFLPEVLSYPFFGLDRRTVWQISVEAARRDALWLEVMESFDKSERPAENEKVRAIAAWLLDLGVRSLSEPLEFMLDYLIGAHIPLRRESDDEETSGTDERADTPAFESPFRTYYFGGGRFENAPQEYLTFLSSLQVFVDALREYKQGEVLGIEDLVAFVDLHEANDIPVVDTSPYTTADEAVQLLTAHKAKGLEFDRVHVLSCLDEVWTPKARGSNLPFPLNMPITPSGDTLDDQLRLFYVALTRAKQTLVMSAYSATEKGKRAMPVQFLAADGEGDELPQAVQEVLRKRGEEPSADEVPATTDVLTGSYASAHQGPFAHEETALLRSLVDEYQMSVTHLNNFLNVAKGGPQYFLEQNLLRFPQAKSPAGAYGTAIHTALERVCTYVRDRQSPPALEQVQDWFEQALRRERLPDHEARSLRDRGREALAVYYPEKRDHFVSTHQPEVNFRSQGVVVGEAHLTGKIDRLVPIDEHTAEVHDYKTGKAKTEWKGGSGFASIQLHQFRQQLIVYKILVEESRDYSKYTVPRGVLEFVEPVRQGGQKRVSELSLAFEADEVERVRSLIDIVYQRIVALDLPSTEGYDATRAGIEQFENDLLADNI